VKLAFVGTPIALPHIKAGRLRALAVTTARRANALPEVPTLAEAGVPDYEATIWIGLFAPAATPPELVARLNAELERVLASAEARASIAATGVEVAPSGSAAFSALVRAEHEKWGKVVRETGATVN
jgi:tripartite-type tricarboxylate transporter receptor subunit TctC